MGAFVKDWLPGWEEYADREGLKLDGRGKWRNALCDFHDDGHPSMRVNTETGVWVCMSCQAKGGDTLSHYMRKTGHNFVSAAKLLGAWDDSGPWQSTPAKPARMAARDALQVIARELLALVVVLSDARQGRLPSDADWRKFLASVGELQWLASEFAA